MQQISFRKTVCDVEVKALVNMLHHSLAKKEAEKPGDKQRDVKT